MKTHLSSSLLFVMVKVGLPLTVKLHYNLAVCALFMKPNSSINNCFPDIYIYIFSPIRSTFLAIRASCRSIFKVKALRYVQKFSYMAQNLEITFLPWYHEVLRTQNKTPVNSRQQEEPRKIGRAHV